MSDNILIIPDTIKNASGKIVKNKSIDKDDIINLLFTAEELEEIQEERDNSWEDDYDEYDPLEYHYYEKIKDIEKIVLPESIERIAPDTFASFENLKEINFPKNLRTIEENAFYNCKSLEHIELNEGLRYIGKGSFYQCNLKEIYIPKTVKEIQLFPFYQNLNLNKIIIDKNNKRYSDMDCNVIYEKKAHILLQGCNVSKIPSETKQIRPHAFTQTKIKEITIPESVERIGEYVFANCNELETIKIKGDTRILYNSFAYCKNIKNIYIYNKCASKMDLSYIEDGDKGLNIYIFDKDTIFDSNSYNKLKKQIHLLTLEELIDNGKSFKEANNIFKGVKVSKNIEDDTER